MQFTHLHETISSRKLRRRVRDMNVVERARLALDLASGAAVVVGMPRKSAAALCGVASGYVGTVAALSPEERRAVESDPHRLSALHHRKRDPDVAGLVERVGVEAIVAAIGPDKLLEMLDLLTGPAPERAAAE